MPRRLAILFLLALFPLGLRGQNFIVEFLTAPDDKLDPQYILQPERNWTVSTYLDYVNGWTDMIMDVVYSEGGTSFDGRFVTDTDKVPYLETGLTVTYGPISLGWGTSVGKGNSSARTNSFRWLDSRMGVSFLYSNVNRPYTADIQTNNNGTWESVLGPASSEFDAGLKSLAVDGYYALNGQRFTYLAAYDGCYIQRRSAGSFMIAAKFSQEQLKFDPRDIGTIEDILFNRGSYGVAGFSVGAGYSFNCVALHREPENARSMKGLRNITLNITAIPMLTLYNVVSTVENVYPDWEECAQEYADRNNLTPPYEQPAFYYGVLDLYASRVQYKKPEKVRGGFVPSFISRAGVSFQYDRFFLNANLDFSRFNLKTRAKEFDYQDGSVYTVRDRGVFSNLTGSLTLNYRF